MSLRYFLDLCRPGVSIRMNSWPSLVMEISSASRVVPGASWTIQRSCWDRLFTSDDLPTLGLPTSMMLMGGFPVKVSGLSLSLCAPV